MENWKNNKNEKKDSERIGRLDHHTIGYYRRVSSSLAEECQNQEENDLLLENVFKQLNSEALTVSRNQTVSTIVESLLHNASASQLLGFTASIAQDWETAIEDRFASYVCQTLLLVMAPHVYACVSDTGEESSGEASLYDHFIKLYRILVGNVSVFMQHTYASHILRVMMEVLGGTRVAPEVIKSKVARRNDKEKENSSLSTAEGIHPKSFRTLLEELTDKISGMVMLKAHAEHYLSNPVLQTVLLVTKAVNVKKTKKISAMCRQIMQNTQLTEKTEELPSLVTSEIGSWLVEQLLHVAPDDVYAEIVALPMCQEEGLLQMADDPIGNFCVQTLITEARDKEEFHHFYKILMPMMERIMAHNHLGIIDKLAKGCIKHGTKQKKFFKTLMEAFHCHAPVERQTKFVSLVLSMRTYEMFYKIKDGEEQSSSDEEDNEENDEPSLPLLTEINLHGSLLLQTMLKFANPHLLTVSFMDLRASELRFLACDPKGSHVVDALLLSTTIGEKTKTQFINKYKGFFTDLSCDKNGSRGIEKMWQNSNLQIRTTIAEELSKHGDRLQGDRFGKFVWRSCALYHFKNRPAEWRNVQSGDLKKRQLFKDILDDDKEPAAKKQKKSKNNTEAAASSLMLEEDVDMDSGSKQPHKKVKHKKK